MMMTMKARTTFSYSLALWAILLIVALQVAPGFMLAATKSNTQAEPSSTPRQIINGWRVNRQTTTRAPCNCECKDLVTNLHDRISVLASLDEDQRNRLENIDNKIVQFEQSNLGRLDSLGAKQMDIGNRLDSMEHLQRLTKREVEEMKGDFEELGKILEHSPSNTANSLYELNLSREIRQAGSPSQQQPNGEANVSTTDDSTKLDSLAVLLTSTRAAINSLHAELQTSFNRVTQTTSNLQRRVNNLQRRVQTINGNAQLPLVTSCSEGTPINDVLQLKLTTMSDPFYVRCDNDWTIVLDRFNGNVSFERDWLEYKAGFGNLAGEYFIGLEKLHALTEASINELYIMLEDWEGVRRIARYNLFAIGGESEDYVLKLLGSYTGDAGDAMTYHAGSKFSTFDNDNDGCPDCNCAQAHNGAWWYNWCEMSNLNGKYYATDYDNAPMFKGMYWQTFHGPNYSLKRVRMAVRPVNADQGNSRR